MSTRLLELLPLIARLAEVDPSFHNLAHLAALDGRSSFHLQRLFRAETGETPLQFRRRVRLQRAAASLLTTKTSLLELALDAGFESQASFTRAFKARFALAPRQFREKLKHAIKQARIYQETANRTAPCIGLYRVPVASSPQNPKPKARPVMPYKVSKKKYSDTPFLYMHSQVKPEEISEALGRMFGPVFQFATSKGIPLAGPPTARYLSYGPGLVSIEAGMPIAGSTDGEGDIQVGSLVGGEVASTIHRGPYDQLNQAHEAIQRWIAENEEEASGAPWEAYLTDPGEVPDPSEWLTEVQYPLKGS